MQHKLIQFRKDLGYSQKQMAEYLNITQKQYCHKELGKVGFWDNEMFKISNLLKKPIEEIFLDNTHQNGENNEIKKETNV